MLKSDQVEYSPRTQSFFFFPYYALLFLSNQKSTSTPSSTSLFVYSYAGMGCYPCETVDKLYLSTKASPPSHVPNIILSSISFQYPLFLIWPSCLLYWSISVNIQTSYYSCQHNPLEQYLPSLLFNENCFVKVTGDFHEVNSRHNFLVLTCLTC